MKRVVTTGETKIIDSTVELSGLRKDGSEFPLELSLSRWQVHQGTFFTAIIRDITERKQVQEQLASQFEKIKELSLHDPLTGLANRSLMNIELRNNFVIARRKKRPLSLIMLDLDNFKKCNDTFGHPAGDKLLVEIAAILTAQIRETDPVVRYGGEEFLIILPETDSPVALQIAERIRTTIMQTEFLLAGNQRPGHITVSMGVATYDKTIKIDNEDRIIVMADEALYQAKNLGRNRVEVYKRPGDDVTQP